MTSNLGAAIVAAGQKAGKSLSEWGKSGNEAANIVLKGQVQHALNEQTHGHNIELNTVRHIFATDLAGTNSANKIAEAAAINKAQGTRERAAKRLDAKNASNKAAQDSSLKIQELTAAVAAAKSAGATELKHESGGSKIHLTGMSPNRKPQQNTASPAALKGAVTKHVRLINNGAGGRQAQDSFAKLVAMHGGNIAAARKAIESHPEFVPNSKPRK